MEEIRRTFSGALDKSFGELEKNLDRMSEITDRMLTMTDHLLADLELDAQQSRLATDADVPTDKKIRKGAEDAAADQAKHGDSCYAKRVHADPTSSTSFGMTAEPPVLSRRDDVLVNKGTEAPKRHFPLVEVRMLPSAAGGLLPTGTVSTVMRTIFTRLFFS